MAGKRNHLSIKEKIDVINKSKKNGLSTRKLTERFEVDETQVGLLLQNKEEVNKAKLEICT